MTLHLNTDTRRKPGPCIHELLDQDANSRESRKRNQKRKKKKDWRHDPGNDHWTESTKRSIQGDEKRQRSRKVKSFLFCHSYSISCWVTTAISGRIESKGKRKLKFHLRQKTLKKRKTNAIFSPKREEEWMTEIQSLWQTVNHHDSSSEFIWILSFSSCLNRFILVCKRCDFRWTWQNTAWSGQAEKEIRVYQEDQEEMYWVMVMKWVQENERKPFGSESLTTQVYVMSTDQVISSASGDSVTFSWTSLQSLEILFQWNRG